MSKMRNNYTSTLLECKIFPDWKPFELPSSRVGAVVCSKQLEGGFSPLMWKGRHYWDDDEGDAAIPLPFSLPLIWFNGLALRRGKEWMIGILPRLGDFLEDNEPIVRGSVIQPNWLSLQSTRSKLIFVSHLWCLHLHPYLLTVFPCGLSIVAVELHPTGCFIPSVTFQTIVISGIDGPILKPFNVVIIHMVRFDIMYGNP